VDRGSFHDKPVDHSLGVGVAAHNFQVIADPIATRVPSTRKVYSLELSADMKIPVERSGWARAERSNEVDTIIDSVGRSEASVRDIEGRTKLAARPVSMVS
jgi:hypothetical protein